MRDRSKPSPWTLLLGVVCIGVLVVAYSSVGRAAQSSSSRRTATVERGVVQSTVSGTGNVSSSSEMEVGFSTAGVVEHVYVKAGEHVEKGQLLATLDPESAEISLEQAKATLLTAQGTLAKEIENDGETTVGASTNSTSGTSSQAGTATTASYRSTGSDAAPVSVTEAVAETGTTPTTTTPTTTTTAPTSTSTTTKTTTTPAKTQSSKESSAGTSSSTSTKSSEAASSTTSSSSVSATTREANLVFAKSAVRSDEAAVRSAELALVHTKLLAPQEGTIITLSGAAGETVTATGSKKVSTAVTSTTSTSGSTSSQASSSSSGASAASASTAFAVISNLKSMQLVVALSEAEIANVHASQPATVTLEALSSKKLAAHVVSVAATSTSSSGVVTYDVVFHLDQLVAGIRAGMSASAEVLVKQAEGLNVLTSAISDDSVTVLRNGKDVRQAVSTGLAGNTSTIILSGLTAGETVLLPAATTTSTSAGTSSRSSSSSSSSGTLGSSAFSGAGAAGGPSGGAPGGGGPP